MSRLKYVHFSMQKFSVVFEQFSLTPKFLAKMQKNPRFFKKNIGFERSCFKILKCMWIQTGLLDLKKTKQMSFCLWSIFNAFLKSIALLEMLRDF